MSLRRRQILRGCSALIAGVAGCTGPSEPDASSSGRASQQGDASAAVEPGSVDDPATVSVRNPTGERVLQGEQVSGSPADVEIVTSREGYEQAIEFAPGVPDEAVDAAEAFFEATSFAESSVYLFRRPPEECTPPRITSVSWTASNVDVEYCWKPGSSHATCGTDETGPTVTFVRIPAPLNPASVTGIGTSGTGCQIGDAGNESTPVDDR